ncbi:MAG: hypothetical protein VXX55_03455 [Planctomycetota bacterium]|nr:hypothetical protein [Planctomycetota bacterium]
MANKTIRVVTREIDGSLKTKEYDSFDALELVHEQIGIDDCSTDLSLRGMPVFRGLVGPIPEGRSVMRYEAPEVFEQLTTEWAAAPATKRKRRRKVKDETATEAVG